MSCYFTEPHPHMIKLLFNFQEELDLPSIVKVFSDHLIHTSVQTKIAVLKWIFHLHTNIPNRMTPHIETLFPVLLKVLCDSSDEVVEHDLEVLAEIISQRPINYKPAENNFQGTSLQNPYFSKFIVSLLDQFRCDRHLLQDRGSFIIRQMCILINPEDIYRTLAEILKVEENLKFATVMVENLNTILLTSSELFDLRSKLKDLKTEESCQIFCCLYETWCHSPVATIALCFLTQNYEHVCEIIKIFGSIEITVELLTEIDKLIQLLESPIFTYLRLELLNVSGNGHLVQALYGLLMLLPQTDAFHTLRHRLECIPKLQMNVKKLDTEPMKNFRCQQIDFSQLVQHFIKVQDKHKLHKNNTRTVTLLKKGAQNIYIDNASTLFN
uniref:Protein VAC14 homolog n=1 Tax=Clastoptera arizonana TaxID=38151 RepID=A0A1B6CSH2_9HEMI